MDILNRRTFESNETEGIIETLSLPLDAPESQSLERVERLEFGYLRSIERDADGIVHVHIFHEDPEESGGLWEIVE